MQSGSDLVDGFYATAVLMLAVICCGFSISSTMRPHGEETNGHLEVLLASALPRRGWLLGHVAVTVGGSVLILASSGLGLGAGYLLVTGEGGEAWALTWPALQYVAPVLVLSAVGRVLFGLLPRLMVLAWVPLVLAAVVMLFGDLFTIPSWVQDLSPFEHLPMVPAESFSWTPVLVLTTVAAAPECRRPDRVRPSRRALASSHVAARSRVARAPGWTREPRRLACGGPCSETSRSW